MRTCTSIDGAEEKEEEEEEEGRERGEGERVRSDGGKVTSGLRQVLQGVMVALDSSDL